MLRLWLDGDDLARVRFAAAPSPLGAAVLSTQPLRSGGDGLYGDWRRRTLQALPPHVRMLFDLVPATGYVPDFLTPVTRGLDFDTELDALRSTSPRRIRGDVAAAFGERRGAPRAARLADGDPDSWRVLMRAIRDYHAAALAPDWQRVRANHQADVAYRARTLAATGMEGLLATMHPGMTWRSPVLEVAAPKGGDLHLGGRGLLFVPSVFVGTTPRVLLDPDSDAPALVVYPARDVRSVWQRPLGTGRDTLASLLGQTRAALLRELAAAREHTTGGLAARLSVSVSAASQHATTLRAAGLITTQRRGQAVYHQLTPLGTDLLQQQDPPD